MTTYLSLCSFGLRGLAFSSATIAATLAFSGMARAQAPVETRKPVEAPAVSRLLPDSIVGLFLVNPEPKLWQDLAKFKTFPRDVTTPGWMFSTLVPELSYHGDIAPWIGGSVATVLLFNPDQTANVYATIAPVRDASQMPKFFDRVKRSRQGKLPTTRLYNGTSILFWEPRKEPDIFSEFESEETTEVTVEADPNSKAGTAAEKAGEAAGKAGEAAKKAGTTPKKTTNAPKKADKTELKTDEAMKEADRKAADRAPLPLPTIEPNQSPEEPKPKSKPKKTIEVGGFAAAYLKSGFVVTSESLAAVQQLIDAEAGTSRRLIDVPGFQRMIQDDRYPKSFISGYANLAALMKSSKLNTPKELAAFNDFPLFQNQSPEQLTQLIEQGSDGIDGFVWAPPEGIQAQVGVHFKGTIAPALIARTNSPNALISRVPAINYGMSGSTNLAFFWRAFTTALDSNKTTKNGLKGFRDFSQGLVGIDDRDIFPWMDKEYMGFAFPAQGSPLTLIEPKLAVGFGGFFQTSDRTAATTALKKVETALTKLSKGEVKITTRKIGDQSLTSWELPGPSASGPKPSKANKSKPNPGKPVSVFAYQWVADDTLAILSGADTAKNLLPKPWQPLDQAVNFKEAIAPLPPENMGYFYLNPPVVLALANQFGLTKMFQPPATETDPELNLDTSINSIFSVAGTTALQPKQLTSDGYAKLATRPIPKLTAQEFIDRAKLKAPSDTDWAIANYSRALSLDSNNADALYGRATAQSQNNNPQGAIEDYDRTIQLEPKKVQAYLDRAKSKNQSYDYLGSLTDANQVLTLTKETDLQSDAYYVRSVSQFNQGNYGTALEDFNQSTTLNSDRPEALAFKCSVEARAAKPTALATCQEATEISTPLEKPTAVPAPSESYDDRPAELSAHLCLARAQAKEPKAFQDCGKALTKEPENPVVHEVQGLARLVAGDRKGAIFSLEKALTLYTQLGDRTAIDRVQTKLTQNK
jgi:tetratricopeptide (TPR) repeat protein